MAGPKSVYHKVLGTWIASSVFVPNGMELEELRKQERSAFEQRLCQQQQDADDFFGKKLAAEKSLLRGELETDFQGVLAQKLEKVREEERENTRHLCQTEHEAELHQKVLQAKELTEKEKDNALADLEKKHSADLEAQREKNAAGLREKDEELQTRLSKANEMHGKELKAVQERHGEQLRGLGEELTEQLNEQWEQRLAAVRLEVLETSEVREALEGALELATNESETKRLSATAGAGNSTLDSWQQEARVVMNSTDSMCQEEVQA